MKRLLEKSRIQYLLKQRNGYLVLAAGSMLINIVLSIGMASMVGHERIILVPPVIERPTWISGNQVSPEYLSSMGIFISDLLLNATSANIEMKHQLLLRYVDSKEYGQFKSNLSEQAERLRKEHISTLFNLTNIKVDTKNFIVLMSGDMQYMTGESLQPAKHITYQINFIYQYGFLKIKSFEEVTKNV